MKERRLLLPEMEGMSARWYARQRGTPSQIAAFREQAAQLTRGIPAGAHVLEVAPGPGYLAIEIARLRGLSVTGLDISRTMVEIARENASAAEFERLVAESRFGGCSIGSDGIALEVRLEKTA